MKILLVDDAMFMRNYLKGILTSLGHEVIGEAENGKIAMDKYKILHPDVVFMDITMPEVDGLAGLKMIRDYNPSAKIIMCSAMGQKDYVIDAIKGGASDFIVKPFQVDKVSQSLRKIVS